LWKKFVAPQPEVLSARAESSCALLKGTLAQHQRQATALVRREHPPRLGATTHDAHNAHRQATILRLVSVTEAFCVERLENLSRAAIDPAASHARLALFGDALRAATGTWQAIRDALKNWHQVEPNWRRNEGVEEVRNTVAHGLGLLTYRQRTSRDRTNERLSRIGITVGVDDELHLEEHDVLEVAAICRKLIEDIDRMSKARLTS
jgi:hypothetical protein